MKELDQHGSASIVCGLHEVPKLGESSTMGNKLILNG